MEYLSEFGFLVTTNRKTIILAKQNKHFSQFLYRKNNTINKLN